MAPDPPEPHPARFTAWVEAELEALDRERCRLHGYDHWLGDCPQNVDSVDAPCGDGLAPVIGVIQPTLEA